jgi:uncharacterized protein (DUF1810 family)
MPSDLEHFVTAQRGVYDGALAELRRGRKTGHWIWFIFPQIAGLGRSAMSERYAIGSADDARAYLAHPTLGPRLRECAAVLLDHADKESEEVLGSIDSIKVRSSMTLFQAAAPHELIFGRVLEAWYGGRPDPATIERLG